MSFGSGYGKKIGNYIIDLSVRLGEGSFGVVHLGKQCETQEIVAIKMMEAKNDDERKQLEQYEKEVKMMSELSHPNIVKLIQNYRTKNNLYIMMEYCEGGTLNQYINKKSKQQNIKYLAESEARIILRQILLGYKFMYDKKIVHRDLKPGNILMKRGKIKICDFGLCKMLANIETDVLKTQAGSPLYMSPQVLLGLQYTSKTDIWSLGVIFYEVLYGNSPWNATTLDELVSCVMKRKLIFPNQPPVSKEMKDIISRMIQLEEKDRMSWDELFTLQYFIDESYRQKLKESVLRIKNEQNEFIRKNLEKNLYIQNFGQNLEHARQQQLVVESEYPKIQLNQNDLDSPQLQQVEYISKDSKEYALNQVIYQEMSDWINHKRNKSQYLNDLLKQMFELYHNGQLKQDQNLFNVVSFTLTKYQILILYKIFNRLQKKSLEGAKRFKEEEWKGFCQTQDYLLAYKTIKNDYVLLKNILLDYIRQAESSLLELNDPFLNEVKEICNLQVIIKKKINQILDQVTTFFFQSIISQVKIEQLSIEYLQFLVNLKNCSKIHSEFNFNNRFDFFKYNDDLMNQSKEDLIMILK